jgi:hypothetical protein
VSCLVEGEKTVDVSNVLLALVPGNGERDSRVM